MTRTIPALGAAFFTAAALGAACFGSAREGQRRPATATACREAPRVLAQPVARSAPACGGDTRTALQQLDSPSPTNPRKPLP